MIPLLALTLVACDTPSSELRILSVTPNQGPAHVEQQVEIEAQHLAPGVRVDYRHPDRSAILGSVRVFLGDQELSGVRWIGRNRVEALIPRGLAVGLYPISVIDWRDRSATLDDAFRVRAPSCAEVPASECTAVAGAEIDRLEPVEAAPDLDPPCIPEVCNGLDDDCDMAVDNGCPVGPISRSEAFESMSIGSSAPDEWLAEGCAPEQVIVGFHGRSGRFIDQLGEHCGTPRIAVDTSTVPHTYSLLIEAAPSAAARGSGGGTSYDVRCPAGQMVAGISGRSEPALIDQFRFSCAEFAIGVDLAIREVPGTRAEAGLVAGGTDGSPFELPCPTDFAVYRMRGALCCSPPLIGMLAIGCRRMSADIR